MPLPVQPKEERLKGNIEPRIFTPPLRELTPDTSYGFDVIDFARNVLKKPLDPWQEWVVIHAGELLPDGRPRFNRLLLLVARQNGKTHLVRVLIAFWLYIEKHRRIVFSSASFERAGEDWDEVEELVLNTPVLKKRTFPRGKGSTRSNGFATLKTREGCQLKAVANKSGRFRGKTLPRIILDELREHETRECYDAAIPTVSTQAHAQIWMLSNAGSDASIVLNEVYETASEYIDSNGQEGDYRIGLFEYSAPVAMNYLDRSGWVMANPNVGWRVDQDTVLIPESIAAKKSPAAEAYFRTEYLCQRVRTMTGAFDAKAWADCQDDEVSISGSKDRVVLCLEMSWDQMHASVVAAVTLPDGRRRVSVVWADSGKGVALKLQQALPRLVKTHSAKKVGWFPNGPSSSLGAWLKPVKGKNPPLAGTSIIEIRDIADACMNFSELVTQHNVVYKTETLLTTHVLGTSWKPMGDRKIFQRRDGNGRDLGCDAAWAAAGAVYLADTLPPPQKPMLVSLGKRE